MASSRKREIDWERVSDLVAMFSATEGEATNACIMVIAMLKQHGLTFVDGIECSEYKRAIWAKCKPPGLRAWIDWKDGKKGAGSGEVDRLRQEVERLETEAGQERERAERAEAELVQVRELSERVLWEIDQLKTAAASVDWNPPMYCGAGVVIMILLMGLWAFVG